MSAVSDKKLAANRANAAQSTGPRTPDGKQRSAKNATTHAAYAADLVLPSESTANFVNLRRAMLVSLSPQTPFELCLVDRAVNLLWRLNRLQAAETGLLVSEESDFADHEREYADLYNARPQAERIPREAPPEDLDPAHFPPGFAAALLFEKTDNPLERLSRAEHRLQGMFHRTLAQLTALQKHRESPDHIPLPCPYLPDDPSANDDDPSDDAPPCDPVQPNATSTPIVQNEPTETPAPPVGLASASETPSQGSPGLSHPSRADGPPAEDPDP